jgi:V/A-type H+-transporting ATPase subunit K
VGIAGAAAISALVEKPQERIWYLIFVALAEAIAIYGLLISFLILAAA